MALFLKLTSTTTPPTTRAYVNMDLVTSMTPRGHATAIVFDKDNFFIVAEGIEKIVEMLDQSRKTDIPVRG